MKILLILTKNENGIKSYEQKRFNNVKSFSSKNENVVVETQNKFYTFKNVGQIFIN